MMNAKSRRRPDLPLEPLASAFTLTDLAVTLAVLSLVAGLSIITLARLQANSRLKLCVSNVGQVEQAVLSFVADNSQSLPGFTPALPGNLWWFYKEQVKAYAGLHGQSSAKDRLFACPDDRGYSDPIPFHLNGRFDFNSYVFNGVTLPGMPNIAGLPVSDVKNPGKTLLVMEWTAHAPLSWHRSKTGRRNMPFYCDAQSVIGFVDGHVNFSKIYYDGCNAAYTQDPLTGYDYQFSGN